MILDEYLPRLNDEEIRRWISLRAVEWMNWPLFVSQPIIPVAMIFLKWWETILAMFILNIGWSAIKYKHYSIPIAISGVVFVRLRWIAAITCGIYFLTMNDYPLAFLSVLWPLLCPLIVIPGKLERTRQIIYKALECYYAFPSRELPMQTLDEEESFSSEEKVLSKLSNPKKENSIAKSIY